MIDLVLGYLQKNLQSINAQPRQHDSSAWRIEFMIESFVPIPCRCQFLFDLFSLLRSYCRSSVLSRPGLSEEQVICNVHSLMRRVPATLGLYKNYSSSRRKDVSTLFWSHWPATEKLLFTQQSPDIAHNARTILRREVYLRTATGRP